MNKQLTFESAQKAWLPTRKLPSMLDGHSTSDYDALGTTSTSIFLNLYLTRKTLI